VIEPVWREDDINPPQLSSRGIIEDELERGVKRRTLIEV